MARKCNPKSEILIACHNFYFKDIQIKGDLKKCKQKFVEFAEMNCQ